MTSRFEILDTPLDGLKVIQRRPIGDSRGYLERLFCAEELRGLIQKRNIVQINHTMTAKRGAIRGLHFQRPPYAETKFVTCLRGEVFDVAVDLREGSPTFLRWHAEVLTPDNHKTLVVTEGFAHGFQTLVENCELIYLHTAAYRPDVEAGLRADDPKLAIRWPQPITELSTRDSSHSLLTPEFVGLAV